MANALIVYHSSTGNTRHCAEVLQAALEGAGHGCELLDTRRARQANLPDYDLIGFATAVYGFRPAHAMGEFLREMPAIEGKPVFLLACCSMIAAKSLWRMQRTVHLKGGRVIAGIEVRGEESWPAVRFPKLIVGKGRPNDDDDERLRAFAANLLERHGRLAAGEDVDPPRLRWFSPWGLIGAITARPVMRYAMLGKKLNEEACTQCGLCARNCPMEAITLEPYPRFGGNCMGCFACVNLCPAEAISTPLTWGRVRYKGHGAGSAPPEQEGHDEGAGADGEKLEG